MSKMDNLRAMREARFERTSTEAAKPTSSPRPRVSPAAEAAPRSKVEPDEDLQDEGLCGHRAISGRTCTRERGHAAKSHRYA